MLYSFARVSAGAGDASAGLLRAGEPGLVVRLHEKGLPDEGVDLAQRSAHARGQRVYTAAGRRAKVVAYGDPPQRRKLEVRRFARDFKRAMHSGPHVARDMLARQASTAKGRAVTVSAGVDSLTVASVLGGRSVERLLSLIPARARSTSRCASGAVPSRARHGISGSSAPRCRRRRPSGAAARVRRRRRTGDTSRCEMTWRRGRSGSRSSRRGPPMSGRRTIGAVRASTTRVRRQ